MNTCLLLLLRGPNSLPGYERLHLWSPSPHRLLDTELSVTSVTFSSPGNTAGPIPQGSGMLRGPTPQSPFLSSIPIVGRGKNHTFLKLHLHFKQPPFSETRSLTSTPRQAPALVRTQDLLCQATGRLRDLWDRRLWGQHLRVTFLHFPKPIFFPPPSQKPGDIVSPSIFPSLSFSSYITYFWKTYFVHGTAYP